jgi:hypothetical protein
MLIGVGLFASFLLIAFAKLIKSDVYGAMLLSLTKTTGLRAFTREAYPVNKVDSLLLVLNYLFATTTALLILFGLPKFQTELRMDYALFIPLGILIWSLGSMYFTQLITGEKNVFVEPIIMKLVGAQFLGLLYFMLSLMWVLNSFDQNIFINIVLWAFIIESVLRLFKSISVVYLQGVSFYYIILYFCTLEILPLIVAYYFIFGDFD